MARQIRRSRRKKPKKLLRRMHNKLYIVFGVLCILFVALIFRAHVYRIHEWGEIRKDRALTAGI